MVELEKGKKDPEGRIYVGPVDAYMAYAPFTIKEGQDAGKTIYYLCLVTPGLEKSVSLKLSKVEKRYFKIPNIDELTNNK